MFTQRTRVRQVCGRPRKIPELGREGAGAGSEERGLCWRMCLCWVLLLFSHSVFSDALRPHELLRSRLLCPWDFFQARYWDGLPFPSPEDLPNSGIELVSLVSPALALNHLNCL